jgi:hypothetical protein
MKHTGSAFCLLYAGYLAYISTLKMEATCSSESSVGFQRTERSYIQEDRTLHNHFIHLCCMFYFSSIVENEMHIVLLGSKANCITILRGRTGGNRALVDSKHRWETNIKPKLKQCSSITRYEYPFYFRTKNFKNS